MKHVLHAYYEAAESRNRLFSAVGNTFCCVGTSRKGFLITFVEKIEALPLKVITISTGSHKRDRTPVSTNSHQSVVGLTSKISLKKLICVQSLHSIFLRLCVTFHVLQYLRD